jgi:hypothetical protein
MGIVAFTTLGAVILAAAPAPEKKPVENDFTKPVLLVKHKDYLIHAVPQSPSGERSLVLDEIHPPLLLLYTSAISGEMKRLAASGHSAVPGPPMGIDRIHHTRTRIVGVVADADRLYVVFHTTNWKAMVPEGGRDGAERKKYELLVFRLTDGEKLHALEMKEGDFPEGMPRDTSEAGPLKVIEGGVICYGVTFEFKGKEVKQGYEKKKE